MSLKARGKYTSSKAQREYMSLKVLKESMRGNPSSSQDEAVEDQAFSIQSSLLLNLNVTMWDMWLLPSVGRPFFQSHKKALI